MIFDVGMNVDQCLETICHELEKEGAFFGHGTNNAMDEAAWLLSAVLENDAELHGGFVPREEDLRRMDRLLRTRVNQKLPLAYLLGEAWFAGLPFYVDNNVLVPRSPLAELIANRFQPLLKTKAARILDLCCGSGCIGIACAMAFPESKVVLADISPEALAVARRNVARHKLGDRVEVVQADLFENLEPSFDLIVSNPPYVSEQEYAALPAEYRHEPKLGLVTGEQGLEIPLRLIREARHYLKPEGLLVVEVGNSEQALAASLPQAPFLWLEFEHGGHGVFALQAGQLKALSPPER